MATVCTPETSVVIPTYNREDVIGRAIRSALSQTYQDLEIIVIDDASVDGTEQVVQRFESDRLSYIRCQTNQGPSAARNRGLKESRGAYIAFLDSDDQWLSTKLEKQIKKIKDSPSKVGAVYTGYWVVRDGVRELGRLPSKRGNIHQAQLARDHVSPTSTVLVRKECFGRVGNFDTSLPNRQDYEMWLRISRHYHFEYVREPLVNLFVSGNRITGNFLSRVEAQERILSSISDEIAQLPTWKRRKIFGCQYYVLARYAQKEGHVEHAKHYIARSLSRNPFSLKSWIVLAALVSGFDVDSVSMIRFKSRMKRRRLEAWDRLR